MTEVQLNDTIELSGVRRTQDGYVTAFARAARSGVQKYRGAELGRPDLDVVRVLRPESEVFSEASLRTYAYRPLTNDHPPEPVTAENWKKYAVGQTGAEILRDKECIRVPVLLMDKDVIRDYEAGKKQLSLGYLSDIKWESGVHDGEPYDAVQTNIRANHLAVVAAARGGSKLVIGDEDENKETIMTDKLRQMVVDGITVEVNDTAHQVFTKAIADSAKRLSDAEEEAAKKAARIKELEDELSSLKEKSKKTEDAATAEIATLKKQVSDAEITPAKLDQMVKDRADVIGKARAVVGDKLIVDGKTLSEIKKQVVLTKLGDAAKEWNDTMVDASFATITKDAKPEDPLAAAFSDNVQSNDSEKRVVDAYRKRDEDISNAWRGGKAA